MRGTLMILLLCAVAFAGALLASEVPTDLMWLESDGRFQPAGTLDDPQPDTLAYDNGSVNSFYSAANHWARVRFTAPTTFEVRSIYFITNNPTNNAAVCSLFVHADDDGELGEVLSAQAYTPCLHLNSFTDPTWNDVNLPTPITINEGDDFFVVAGPAPGGPQAAGWHIILDNSPVGRSALGTAGHYGAYSLTGVNDWLLRVGGAADPFVDLKAEECYNEGAGNEPSFFILPGEELTFNAQIFNNGNTDVAAYTVQWNVEGPDGSEVFSDETVGTDLNSGATAQVTGTAPFLHVDEGEYIVTCAVSTDGDAAPDNDITFLRYFVQDRDVWYRYDDGVPEGSSSFVPDNGWAVSFAPSSYPAEVESIAVNLSFTGVANANLALFVHTPNELPEAEAAWADCVQVVPGWNTIAIVPPVLLFDGDAVAIRYLYSGMALAKDDTPPNAAGITNMGSVAFSSEGGTWSVDDAGNWCIDAYLAESNAVPPWPVFESSVTALGFGLVPINAPATQTFWVFNRGAVDDLQVTSTSIVPPAAAAVYEFNPANYTVAAGESLEVAVTFSPTNIGTNYNGLCTINNNSDNDPAFRITVSGTGDEPGAAGDPANGLPTEFALFQNYPNPFNPSTEIQFALPVNADVNLTVINLLGQEVATLASGFRTAGVHTVSFNADNLPAGLYLYRLQAADFTAIRKMMLVK